MRKQLLRLCRDERGVSAVEFALASALILTPLLLGATELGRRVWVKKQFENAVQAGLDYAMFKSCSFQTSTVVTCGITASGMQSAVQTSTELGTAVTVAPPAGCGGAYFCYGCPGTSTVALSTASTNCGSGGTSGTYAGLTATYNYTPLFQSCGSLLPSSICSATPTTWTVTEVARVF
jgi:Flp pilus assembly protein TadG